MARLIRQVYRLVRLHNCGTSSWICGQVKWTRTIFPPAAYSRLPDDPLYDIGPMPCGNGVVDIEDLKVFIKYWGEANALESEEVQ